MKRLIDILVSFTGLLLIGPLLLLLGLLVWISDPGPVLFSQTRMGRRGKKFRIHKFRTMRIPSKGAQKAFEPGNTSRITALGRILRRSKLDELPQLVNVLFGQMSLVGPRPEVEEWIRIYPERWEKVLSLRPGMTDNASLVYRNEEEILSRAGDPEAAYRDEILPAKLDLYESYVDSHSVWGDLGILFRTVTILFKKNS